MMKKHFLAAAALVVSLGMSSQAQEITPVWEYLATDNSDVHPWLRAANGTNSHETTDTMDFTTSLARYDNDRLMLFIIENGVDEANASPEQLELSEQFPDRSILWINAIDGSPMGVAIHVGIHPADDSEYYIQKVTGTHPDGPTSDRSWQLNDPWPQMAVDGDGYVYVGDKHKILRYVPEGDGFSGPEIVYTYPEQDPPINSVNPANLHYRAWLVKSLNVVGSGNNKVMTTAARFWVDGGGIMYYTSSNGGATFEFQTHKGQEQRGGIGTGGAASAPIVISDLGEEWMFGNGFPGSDDRIYRFIRTAGTADEFFQDVAEIWDPLADPADVPEIEKYMKWNVIDVAAAQGVPFIAALTLPKWDSHLDPELEDATAWVALHAITGDPDGDGIDGDFISSYSINFHEKDEPQGVNGDEQYWDAAYMATINMSVPDGFPEGTAEILWSGGSFGFGRLVVGDVDLPTNVNEWSLY
jgi:hypothetical protein